MLPMMRAGQTSSEKGWACAQKNTGSAPGLGALQFNAAPEAARRDAPTRKWPQ
jgi:hypothetical protein